MTRPYFQTAVASGLDPPGAHITFVSNRARNAT